MFVIWQTRKIKFVLCNSFLLADILLANGDEMNLNLPKFVRLGYGLVFSSGFLTLQLLFLVETFSPQHVTFLDGGLVGKIKTAVIIDFNQSNSYILWFPERHSRIIM